jgi:hypothetical protein
MERGYTMKEQTMFISWGQVPRGREAKAIEVFKRAHEFLKGKKKEGKIEELRIYFNSQSADLAGFMLIGGKPEFLLDGSRELERLYMQASAVVDNLSLKILVGGTENGITEHLNDWLEVQKELGFID